MNDHDKQMPNLKWHSAFRDTDRIFRQHGLIVWLFYWFTGLLSLASISHWVRWLPNKMLFLGYTHDKDTGKTKAWLQDTVALIVFVLTPLAIYLSWCKCVAAYVAGLLLAIYLIYDSISRHVRIMWFDDLEPRTPESRREVWSHRRILFLAILSYGVSIFLFTTLLHFQVPLINETFTSLLQRSFGTATLTSLPQVLTKVDIAQVVVSLFYLAIVVATTASIAYARDEVELPELEAYDDGGGDGDD